MGSTVSMPPLKALTESQHLTVWLWEQVGVVRASMSSAVGRAVAARATERMVKMDLNCILA